MNKSGSEQSRLISIAKHSGLGIWGRVFFLGSRFIITLLITRTVGPDLYGILVLATGIMTFIEGLSLLGLETTLIKYTSQYVAENDLARVHSTIAYALKLVLTLSLLLVMILYWSAGFIADEIFHKENLASMIRVLLPGVPCMSVMVILLAALQGAKLLKYRILVQQFLMPVFRFIAVGIALAFGLKIIGVAWAWVFTTFFGVVASIVLITKKMGLSLKNSVEVNKKELMSYSMLIFVSQMLYQNINSFGVMIIGIFLSADQVGIYGVAMRAVPFILIPFVSYNAIFSPVITDLFTKGSMKELESMYKSGNKWVMTISLPIFILIVTMVDEIALIFGKGFKGSAPIIVIVLIGQLLNVCTGSCGQILTMTGKARYNLYNTAALCVLNIALTLLLVPYFGLNGAAWAYSMAIMSIQLLQTIEVWRLYRLHPFRLDNFKPLMSGVVSSIVILYVKAIMPQVSALFGVAMLTTIFLGCYTGMIIVLGLSADDRLVLERATNKFKRII